MADSSKGDRRLLVVGARYHESDNLDELCGAEKDADNLFRILTDPVRGAYDLDRAQKLLSPTKDELVAQLNEILFDPTAPEVFTFCFSGHGASRDTGYYLALRDTNTRNLAGTGLALGQLFAMVGESRPQQAFVLLDSCEAGGLITDLRKVASPDLLGSKDCPSISVFASSCADQSAKEDGFGGFVTQEVVKYIAGDQLVNTSHEYLDLAEIGRGVSSDETISSRDQEPTMWGLHLTGEAKFVKNPHFDSRETKQADYTGLPASSAEGGIIAEHSSGLREVFLELQDEFRPRRLVDEIKLLCEHLLENGSDHNGVEALIAGIAKSFPIRAADHHNGFVEVEILASCVVALLPLMDENLGHQSLFCSICDDLMRFGSDASEECLRAIETEEFALRSNRSGVADLFFLPLRVSRLLGWFGAFVLIDAKLQGDNLEYQQRLERLCDLVLEKYSGSILSVSDEQAPYLLIFFVACMATNNGERAELVLSYMMHDFLSKQGNVASPEIEGKQVLDFLLARHLSNYEGVAPSLARPTELFPVLLFATSLLKLPEIVNFDLRDLDHMPFNVFIPDDYRSFGESMIRDGVNLTFSVGSEVGLGVFELSDFESGFQEHCLRKIKTIDSRELETVAVGGLLSSLIFPDRVCWLIAEWVT